MSVGNEAHKALQFLASMPTGHTTLTRGPLKELLLATDGQMMACGSLFNIKSKRIGAGVYEVRLERWKPAGLRSALERERCAVIAENDGVAGQLIAKLIRGEHG